MKLEVGKTYIARNGDLVIIRRYNPAHNAYPFIDDSGFSYMPNGAYLSEESDSRDLIEEVVPAAPTPTEENPVQNFERVTKYPEQSHYILTTTNTTSPVTFKPNRIEIAEDLLRLGLISKRPTEFKVGDKVFDILRGEVHKLVERDDEEFCFRAGKDSLTRDGRWLREHKYPRFISIAEAKSKGYDVPVQKVKKSKTVTIGYSPKFNTVQIHGPLGDDEVDKKVTFEWEEEV